MDNVSELHRPISITIDGRPYTIVERKLLAADLLRLAGLDPSQFDLGELKGHRPHPVRFGDDEIVEVREGSRFVSIRQKADVA